MDLFPIVYSNEDGEFLLYDKSFGNPGCDVCGENDAVVKAGGTYFCQHCIKSESVRGKYGIDITVIPPFDLPSIDIHFVKDSNIGLML